MAPSPASVAAEAAKMPNSHDRARQDLNVAQLTAKAELVMDELAGVIADMATLLRKGASDVNRPDA